MTREPDDDAVGRLFALPLEHFVPERDALAKALRAGGRREEAAAVKALAKPSLPAWALNQLAHGRPEEVGAFLAATERLEAAQGELLAGGDREAWRAAAAELAAATERLLALARGLSDDRSRPLSAATLDRVRATLQAMGSDPEARELLRRGRLDREREPGGLGAAFLAGGAPAPARAPGRRGGKRAAKAGRAAGGKAERGSAAEAERRAAAEAERHGEAEAERGSATEAEPRADAAAERRAEAAHRADAARRAEAARRAAEERERALEAARRDEARARAELAAAQERVAERESALAAARAERDRRAEALAAAIHRREALEG